MSHSTPEQADDTWTTISAGRRLQFSVVESRMVALEVGHGVHTTLSVHGDLLKHVSTLFKAAVENKDTDSPYQVIRLEEERVDTVKIFVHWAYFGALYVPRAVIRDSDVREEKTEVSISAETLVRVWIFGSKYGIAAMQNDVIVALHKRVLQTWAINASLVPYIYIHTSPGCELRRFQIELYVITKFLKDDALVRMKQKYRDWNAEDFLFDLARRLLRVSSDESAIHHEVEVALKELDVSKFFVPRNDAHKESSPEMQL